MISSISGLYFNCWSSGLHGLVYLWPGKVHLFWGQEAFRSLNECQCFCRNNFWEFYSEHQQNLCDFSNTSQKHLSRQNFHAWTNPNRPGQYSVSCIFGLVQQLTSNFLDDGFHFFCSIINHLFLQLWVSQSFQGIIDVPAGFNPFFCKIRNTFFQESVKCCFAPSVQKTFALC